MMNENIKVSLILPVYKVSDYIERCVKSVMNQTYKNIECILVDDASPDDSIEICERLIAEYDGSIRFKIVHHEKNRGISAARNTGTDVATGDYISYMDSDDELLPDCIEKLVRPIEKDPTIEMVVANYGFCRESSFDPQMRIVEEQDFAQRELACEYYYNQKGFLGTVWNRLLKREFIVQNHVYSIEGLMFEDLLWTFYVMKYLRHLYVIPDVTYKYRLHPVSFIATNTKERCAFHYRRGYDMIAENLTDDNRAMEAKYYMRSFCFMTINCLDYIDFRRIGKKFMKALWEERCLKDWLALNVVVFLSRFQWGKNLFLWAANKVRGRRA